MVSRLGIAQIRALVNRERVYVLMLGFILLVQTWLIFAQKVPGMKEGFVGQKVFGLHLEQEVEEPVNDVTKKYEQLLWNEVWEKQRPVPPLLNILGSLGSFIFAFGLFLDIRILMARIKKREILTVTPAYAQMIKWGVSDIFKLVIIFVFLGYLLHIFESSLVSLLPQRKNWLEVIPLLNAGIMDLALLGFMFYFLKVKYKQNLAAMGLKIKGAFRNIFFAVLSYIAFLPILGLILVAVIIIAAVFNYQPPRQVLFKLFLEEKRPWFLVYSSLMVVILGPVVEEIFFRGFTYNAFKHRWGVHKAMLLTAVIFAALHTNLIGFLPILALGLLLVYVYEKTGALICPITIHIVHNSLMVTCLFLGRYFMQLTGSG